MSGPDKYFYAPWERAFEKLATPFEEFLHRQTTIGILLIFCALIAMVVANSPLAGAYFAFLKTDIALHIGDRVISHSIHHWINDGLMTLFFFVVGLEIKREILVGELSSWKNALLPIVAAVGGMVFPALFYLAVAGGGPNAAGWGIPMATDIAFAVGIMALLGNRIPRSLLTFLVALAIVDDLGAVTAIAVFYTDAIYPQYLIAAGLIVTAMFFLNLLGIRRVWPYLLLALALWMAMEGSGIHATIAGIVAALCIPSYSRMNPADFGGLMSKHIDEFKARDQHGQPLLNNPHQAKLLWHMEHTLNHAVAPLQILESSLHIPVTYLVIPLFALANAGLMLDPDHLVVALAEPVTLGIVIGLVLGKLVGIVGLSLLAIKLGIARLPEGVTISHLVGAGCLAGIGFTMSIFISEQAFPGEFELLNAAKTGILAASLISGIAGYLWLRLRA